MKSKEEMIMDELRSLRETSVQLSQWGVAVLVAMQTAIYFVRKDVWQTLLDKKLLGAGQPLPMQNYRLGTIGLLMVATIFSILTLLISRNAVHYRKQLLEDKTCLLTHRPLTRHYVAMGLICILYFLFPILDYILRIYKIEVGILW